MTERKPPEPSTSQIVPDSQHGGIIARLPQRPRDFAQLARFDRPIGWWLLFWPCVWGVWLAGSGWQLALLAWLLLGSIAMRGVGCVYNDIVDADLDSKVARTASRPVASGRVSGKAAWTWLLVLCLIGLLVFMQLRLTAQIVALASVLLVAAYPFMKRITWWPQAWLGLVFTWGLLVGWTQLRGDNWDALAAMYAGAVFWVIGYDTIYALQDREDDALVGIRSSALRLGRNVRGGIAACYLLALGFWMLAFWLLRADIVALLALLPAGVHLLWQVTTLAEDNEGGAGDALDRFRSNRLTGALVAAACFVVGNA